MAEPEASGSSEQSTTSITFNVKAANDAKYVLTLPTTSTVGDLKTQLSTPEHADIPPERQRLIYSGRVLKDGDTLSSTKIKDGHTVHLVKGAASNARQNPASTSTPGTSAAPALPSMAAGTGNNPLAALTGARYAGFHGLPNASSFGADGGMGPPPNPQELERMLDDPNFLSQMNEMLNNPAFLEMMEQSPMLRNSPEARRMFQDPAYRRLIMNPELIRAQMRMQASMGQRGAGSFPAPGVTDTTPQTGGGSQNANTPGQNAAATPSPFDVLRGGAVPPTGAGGAAVNPFAALFGPTAGPNPSQNTSGDATSNTTSAAPANPFGNLFGTGGPSPDLMRAMMQGMGGGNAAGTAGAASPFGDEGTNAAAMRLMEDPGFMRAMGEAMDDHTLFSGLAGGAGGFGATPPPPADTRPPEERYADQLRQLNDMGFYEFERNVTALRRSGGSVQGAVEYLLTSPPTGDS